MSIRIAKAIVTASCALVASGADCAARWGPTWSELTGNLYSRTQMNRTAATIKQVDGKHETKRIVKVEPGARKVVVASPMRKGFHGSDATLDMTLEPCKRYYINAQFENTITQDWKPVIDYVEPISGCKIVAAQK